MIRRIYLVLATILPVLLAASAHAASPVGQVQSGAIRSSEQLRIPLSTAYPPIGFKTNANTSTTAADADAGTLQALFLHGGYLRSNQAYRDIGALGLWYQEFITALPDAHSMWLTYLGSYYSSPDTAAAAFNDVEGSGIFSHAQTCQVPGADQCLDVTLGFVGPNIDPTLFPVSYADDWRIVLKSNALMESGYLIPRSDLAADQALGETTLDTMTASFVGLVNGSTAATPTPARATSIPPTPRKTPVKPKATPKPTLSTATPAPVRFQLHNIRVEKVGARLNADKPGMGVLKTGSKVNLSVYIVISAPAGTAVQTAIEVLQMKKALLQKSKTLHLPRDESDATLRIIFPIRVRGTGTQTIRADVRVGTALVQAGTIKVKVKK